MFSRAVVLTIFAALVAAQSPEFEVATVKLSPPPEGDLININLGSAIHGRVTLTNATLSDCLKFAYNLSSDAQLEAPDWVRRGPERYDIVAQAPVSLPNDRLREMLQKLLADRLNLRLHHEQRVLSFAALTIAKGGPKMQSVAPETAPGTGPALPGRIVSPRLSMVTLAKLLARFRRENVLDLTGLDGYYAVDLEYAATDDSPGLSLYDALQKELGLKLESRKGPIDVLVVDRADKIPAAN